MAVKLSSLRANVRRENEGDWIDIPEWGAKIKVRGFAYGPFQNAKSNLEAKWARRTGGRDTVPYEETYKANGRLYAQHLLIDWQGFIDDDGREIPFSTERALEILTDPGFRDLHDHIRLATNKISQVEAEWVEDTAGNSVGSSGMNSMAAA